MYEWIFVTGMPRSGTTLAAYLLNLHPECCVLVETGFPAHIAEALEPPIDMDDGYCSVEWRGQMLTAVTNWQLARLSSEGQAKRAHLPEVAALTVAMCNAVRSFWPARLFGDKSSAYCFHWQKLRGLFPGCRIVVCDRDLEATARSVARQSWAPDCADHEQLLQRLQSYRNAIIECPDILRLKLETLEANPELSLTGLLEGLELATGCYDMETAVWQVRHGRVN